MIINLNKIASNYNLPTLERFITSVNVKKKARVKIKKKKGVDKYIY